MRTKLTNEQADHLRRIAFRVSYRVLRHEENAYDIAQETLGRLLAAKSAPTSAAGWCHTTALRLSLNLVRDSANRRRILDQHVRPVEPSQDSLEERVLVLELLESASERASIALWCRVVNGMSTKETADLLDVSERTVRDDLAKLRIASKERLEEDA